MHTEVSARDKDRWPVKRLPRCWNFAADPDSPYHDKKSIRKRPLSSNGASAVVPALSPGRSSMIWVDEKFIIFGGFTEFDRLRSKRSKNRRNHTGDYGACQST